MTNQHTNCEYCSNSATCIELKRYNWHKDPNKPYREVYVCGSCLRLLRKNGDITNSPYNPNRMIFTEELTNSTSQYKF